MELSTINKLFLISKPVIFALLFALYTLITHRKFAILYIMTSFYAIIYSLSDYIHGVYLGLVHLAQVFETPWYVAAMPYVLPAAATAVTGVFIGRRMKKAQAVKTEGEARVIEGDAMSKMQENYLVMIEHVNAQLSDITHDNKLLREEVDKLQQTIKERDLKIDELLSQLRLYIRDED